MIVELVTFQAPTGWSREQTLEDAKHTIPKWTANRELLRKHFLRGIGEASDTGAGIYIWPSIESAQKAHNEEWRQAVRKRTGGDPTIRYFDMFLLIDNERGKVTEWDGDGQPRAVEHAKLETV
jgi:hypothetical protein